MKRLPGREQIIQGTLHPIIITLVRTSTRSMPEKLHCSYKIHQGSKSPEKLKAGSPILKHPPMKPPQSKTNLTVLSKRIAKYQMETIRTASFRRII